MPIISMAHSFPSRRNKKKKTTATAATATETKKKIQRKHINYRYYCKTLLLLLLSSSLLQYIFWRWFLKFLSLFFLLLFCFMSWRIYFSCVRLCSVSRLESIHFNSTFKCWTLFLLLPNFYSIYKFYCTEWFILPSVQYNFEMLGNNWVGRIAVLHASHQHHHIRNALMVSPIVNNVYEM